MLCDTDQQSRGIHVTLFSRACVDKNRGTDAIDGGYWTYDVATEQPPPPRTQIIVQYVQGPCPKCGAETMPENPELLKSQEVKSPAVGEKVPPPPLEKGQDNDKRGLNERWT
jgi:hypothetical protein